MEGQIAQAEVSRQGRFPIARIRAIDKKSRQLNNSEQILSEKVCKLFRNSL